MTQVTIEQAACTALAAAFRARLPGITLLDRWPTTEVLTTPTISIITGATANEELVQPEEHVAEMVIHDGVSAPVESAAPATLSDAIAALNALAASYEAHRVDLAAHATADTTNALTAPTATNLATAIALANDLKAQLNAHIIDVAHENPDKRNGVTTASATNLSTLLLLTARLLVAVNQHYIARLYVYRAADVEHPVQLDVWAVKDEQRDAVMARLLPLLRAGTALLDGPELPMAGSDGSYDPVQGSVYVQVDDGWEAIGEFVFYQPSRSNTSDGKQRREYRATYAGTLRLPQLIIAQAPRIVTGQATIETTAGTTTMTATEAGGVVATP